MASSINFSFNLAISSKLDKFIKIKKFCDGVLQKIEEGLTHQPVDIKVISDLGDGEMNQQIEKERQNKTIEFQIILPTTIRVYTKEIANPKEVAYPLDIANIHFGILVDDFPAIVSDTVILKENKLHSNFNKFNGLLVTIQQMIDKITEQLKPGIRQEYLIEYTRKLTKELGCEFIGDTLLYKLITLPFEGDFISELQFGPFKQEEEIQLYEAYNLNLCLSFDQNKDDFKDFKFADFIRAHYNSHSYSEKQVFQLSATYFIFKEGPIKICGFPGKDFKNTNILENKLKQFIEEVFQRILLFIFIFEDKQSQMKNNIEVLQQQKYVEKELFNQNDIFTQMEQQIITIKKLVLMVLQVYKFIDKLGESVKLTVNSIFKQIDCLLANNNEMRENLQERKFKIRDQKTLNINAEQTEQRRKELQREREKKIETELIKQEQLISQQQLFNDLEATQDSNTKIEILEQEVQKVINDEKVTQPFQTYQIAKCEQKKLQILKETGKANQVQQKEEIQNLTIDNQQLLFYVLNENLKLDQKRELIITAQSQTNGFNSVLSATASDQQCMKFHSENEQFEEINSDLCKKFSLVKEFKRQLAKNLRIPIEEIEVLDIAKGSVQILYKTTTKEFNNEEIKVLERVCKGRIDVYNYFAGANRLVGLSSEDFDPTHNQTWFSNGQKELRGPSYHRYYYYFPIGYYGYALNLKGKYGDNYKWLGMYGDDEEWRILYHGTNQEYLENILKEGFVQGKQQYYYDQICELTQQKVGKGVYFSDKVGVCEEYANPTQIGNKKFKLVFQSRVNPRAVRQSYQMQQLNYFVVNESKDIRPYRILLKEVQ